MGKLGTIITQTPFRISFFGGGTDFPYYFNKYGGSVLGTTINKYLYTSVNSLERLLEKRIRISYARLEVVDDPRELKHDMAREILLKHSHLLNGGFIDINTFADLPYGSGMGSSSAFTVGFLSAFYSLHQVYRTPREISREAIEVEREILRYSGGWQDQIHAAYGGLNRIDFFDNTYRVTPVPISREAQKAIEASSMLFFTGLIRESAAIQEKVFSNRRDSSEIENPFTDKQIVSLAHMREMVERGYRCLTQTQENSMLVEEFGRLLHETWEHKRSLSDTINTGATHEIYEAALRAGAYGGKLLGAGGGGFFLFIVPPNKKESVSQALRSLKQVEFKFEKDGTRIVYVR